MPVPSARDLIPRASLIEAVSSSITSHRLTIIQAPPGYGKTSTATLAITASKVPVAWYTAEPWQVGNFIEPLVDEVRGVRDDFGRLTLAVAGRGRPDTDDPSALRLWAMRVGATFAKELRNVPQRLVLVFEDYHSLETDPMLPGFVAGAWRQLPESVSLLLVGRSIPALPLAEWTSQGLAVQFGAADLRFTPAETLLLAHKHGVELDEKRAAALCEQCEGWPAGISLLVGARSRATAGSPQQDVDPSRLTEQHLEELPQRLVTFLERIAPLDVLDLSMLEQHGGLPEARALFKDLERRGEMLTVVRPGETYRLHPLMREALMERVRNRDGNAGVARNHIWAAEMLQVAGRQAPALFHLQAARDDVRLVAFLAKRVDELFADGRGEQVAKTVRELSRRGVDEPILIGRVQGMLLRQRGLPGAHELFLAALEIATQRGDQDAAFALRVLLLWEALDRLEPQATTEILGFASETSALSARQRATALILLGWAKAIGGDFGAALEKAAAAAELGAGSADLRFRAALLYAYACTCIGDFTRADAAMSELLRDLEASEHVVLLCYTLFWYGRLSLLWGDFNAAADYVRQGVALGRHLNLHAELASAHHVLAEIGAAAGDRDANAKAVEMVLEHAPAAWYEADRHRFGAHAMRSVARCAFVAGSASDALEASRKAFEESAPSSAVRAALEADRALYSVLLENADAVHMLAGAAADVAQAVPLDAVDAGALASAESLLELISAVVPEHKVAVSATLPAARAFSSYIESRKDLAELRELATSLRRLMMATRGEHSDDGTGIVSAYERLKHRGAGFEAAALAALVRFLARRRPAVAAAFGTTHPLLAGEEKPAARASGPVTLTKREEEVLSLVALGLMNKEIAQRLNLSRRTVETYVERVLSKLNAASRTRAVAEAVRTGILPPSALGGPDDEQSA